MKKLILASIIVIAGLAGISAFGQSATIKGTILDSATREPIPYVNVILSMKGTQVAGTTSDFDGKYKMIALNPGRYELKASFVGFKVVELKNITLVVDSVNTIDLLMVPSTEELEEIQVVTGFRVGKVSASQTSAAYLHGVVVKQSTSRGSTLKAPDRDFESDAKFQAGQLTASEINDFYKWDQWKATSEKHLQNLWKLYADNRYSVQVKGKNNKPVPDAVVELVDASGSILWKCMTDNTGKAELWSGMSDDKNKKAQAINVIYANETYTYNAPHEFKSGINVMILPVECKAPETVDIMFVVDATGSMDDEIVYLKRELDDILTFVEKNNPALNTRTAAIYYCADGNSPVTTYSDFTSKQSVTSSFVRTQNFQNCGGEEAVDKALELAVNLSWSKSSHARLMFFMLDAPPFRDDETIVQLQKATALAAEKGIRIIPIVASAEEMGMAVPLEYLMRSIALATNGTYVFLTDHSKIGDEHATPKTDAYDVELLNDAIKRLIKQYTYYTPCEMIVEQGIQDTTVLFAKKIIAHEVVDSTITIASVTPQNIIVDFTTPSGTIQDTVSITPVVTGTPVVDTITSIGVPENTPYIKYFPNPTNGELTVQVFGDIKEIEILDISGKLMQTVKARPEVHLSLSDYSSGIYFIRFNDHGKPVTGKIVLK